MAVPGRVWGAHGPSPQPGDHSRLPSTLGGGQGHVRIEMADLLPGPLPHPPTVVADVLRQSLCSIPHGRTQILPIFGIDRMPSGKARRNLHHCLANQHCHRIQVSPIRGQPQPLRLQRYSPSTRKRIEHIGHFPTTGLDDLRPRVPQHVRIVGVLPHDQPSKNLKQSFPLSFLGILSRKPIRMSRRVIHQRSPQHRPRRRQRPSRPPQMQSRRMPMPNRLLPSRSPTDRLQR